MCHRRQKVVSKDVDSEALSKAPTYQLTHIHFRACALKCIWVSWYGLFQNTYISTNMYPLLDISPSLICVACFQPQPAFLRSFHTAFQLADFSSCVGNFSFLLNEIIPNSVRQIVPRPELIWKKCRLPNFHSIALTSGPLKWSMGEFILY